MSKNEVNDIIKQAVKESDNLKVIVDSVVIRPKYDNDKPMIFDSDRLSNIKWKATDIKRPTKYTTVKHVPTVELVAFPTVDEVTDSRLKTVHKIQTIKAEFDRLTKTNDIDGMREFKESLNSVEKRLLRIVRRDNSFVYSLTEKPTKKSGLNAFTEYKKLANKIDENIDLNHTVMSHVSDTCKQERQTFPVLSSGLKRDLYSDEIVFYESLGLWFRMSKKSGANSFWIDEVKDEIKQVYYLHRINGFSRSHSRQMAKLESFKLVQIYNEVWKAVKRNYEIKQECECSECYFERPFNCLNGQLKPYVPSYENIESIQTEEKLNSVILGQWLKVNDEDSKRSFETFKKRLLKLCDNEKDVLIIDGLINGQTKNDIAKTVGLRRLAVYNRIAKIATKYQAVYSH